MVGGQVAGSQACCCENPPPPFCGCPDFCIYRIEVVSPGSLAAKSSIPALCGSITDIRRIEAPVTALPSDLCNVAECQPWIGGVDANVTRSFVELAVANRSPYLGANVGESFFVTGFPEWSGSTGFITFGIAVEIRCIDYVGPVPSFYVRIRTSFLLYQSNRWTDGSFVASSGSRTATFDLTTSACQTIGGSRTLCEIGEQRARYITTPLTFDASWDTTSLGDYQFDYIEGAPPGFDPRYQALLDEILASFSATFRITSRPNCDSPIACECGPYLDGLLLQFDGVGYWIGTEVETWTDFSGEGEARRAYGTQASWTVVHDKTDGFNLVIFNRRQLDIYCETTVDGPVWRALIRTYCYEDGAIGEDVWMGRFECYKTVCEDLEKNRPLDQPIPQEEPVEVEYLGRTYFGATDCTPPPRPSVRLEQITSC